MQLKTLIEEIAMKNKKSPCWKGYEMVGTKKKNNKEVPNCVPVKENKCTCGEDYTIEEYDVVNEDDYNDFIPFLENLLNSPEDLSEAEVKGKKVKLGKVMRGDAKKYKVYVKNPKGNVVKVNFGDPNMEIKRDDPKRRKSFRARHKCNTPGPRHKARYWACKTWSSTPASKMLKK